jgi:hypothetical protein
LANDTTTGDIASALEDLEQVGGRFADGLYARVSSLSDVPSEFQGLQASLAAAGTSGLLLCFQIILTVALVACVFILLSWWFKQASAGKGGWRGFLAGVAAAVPALAIGIFAAPLLAGSGLPVRILRLWAVVTIVFFHDPLRGEIGPAGVKTIRVFASHRPSGGAVA